MKTQCIRICGIIKAVLRNKFISLNIYFSKKKKYLKHITSAFTFTNWGKKKTNLKQIEEKK